jgi:tetratricopeptide (TPR) repeat protein
MRSHDQQRPPLPVHLTQAERDFYLELRRLVDAAGLSIRGLEESTSAVKSEAGESSFYSKSQWGRWLNGQSLPPRKAVRKLAEKLAAEDIEADHLVDLWARAFVPTRYPAEPGSALVRPRQLPVDTRQFMGRTAELAVIDRLAVQAAAGGGVMVIVIEGTAGVGKTTLASHLAHHLSDRFPDGQLWVSLRGFDDTGEPMPDGEALHGFLEALGVPPGGLPAGTDEQAALYRSLLADRRILVVLDNARDARQVRRLLPGSPGSLVLVTSRNQLTGLAAEGAHVLRLGPFTMSEARGLLEHRLGAARVQREPQAADELISLCARLPLALSVAAARAAARPDFPLEVLASDLRSRGLDLLDTGDPATTARTVFSTSYASLSDAAARMFRLLGIRPGPDIGVPAAASLAAVPVEQARKTIDELARAYLVDEHLPGRFTIHDLLHAYAAELAREEEETDEQDAALLRLLDHYLRGMDAAVGLLYPARPPVPLPEPVAGVRAESFGPQAHAQALAWFRAELPAVRSLIRYAARRGGFDAYCWRLPAVMAPMLARGSFLHDYLAAERTAITAAGNLGDALGQGIAHYEFAHASALLGEVGESEAHLKEALRWFTKADDQAAAARAVNGMSQLLLQDGKYTQALERETEALELRRALGDPNAIAHSEQTMGDIYARLGRHDEAVRHCQRSLDLSRETGHRVLSADALAVLGFVYLSLADHDRAVACYMEVLAIYREIGDSLGAAKALTGLGDAQQASGNTAEARASWTQALTILSELPNADSEPVKARLAHPGDTRRRTDVLSIYPGRAETDSKQG